LTTAVKPIKEAKVQLGRKNKNRQCHRKLVDVRNNAPLMVLKLALSVALALTLT